VRIVRGITRRDAQSQEVDSLTMFETPPSSARFDSMGTLQDEKMYAFWVAQRSVTSMQLRLSREADPGRARAFQNFLEEEERKLTALS